MARIHGGKIGTLSLVAWLLGAACGTAHAQNFEAYYGETPWRDRGEDVKWVRYCSGGGSIAVGTRAHATLGAETLVTRVDNLGATLWQRSYRVAEARFSGANAVVEIRESRPGFAIAGYASTDDTRMFVMRIDCEGEPVWTRLFVNQDSPGRGIGYDVVTLPTTAANPNPDLVVVGEERFANGMSQGRIARLDSSGNPAFDLAYGDPTAPPGMRFRAATLATNSTGSAGDLVVAGSTGRFSDWQFDRRALMFRVRFDGSWICDAVLGRFDSPSEDYTGATSLTAPASLRGQTVLVGTTTPAAGSNGQRPYLTRFRAGSCVPLAQSVWTFPNETANAVDVQEFPAAGAGGRIAVNGTVHNANLSEGHVAWADANTLAPFMPLQRFGLHGAGSETLQALDVEEDRLVMDGSTATDWDATGDRQDLYLVQPDSFLRTLCSLTWTILPSTVELPYERFVPKIVKLEAPKKVESPSMRTEGEGYCCELAPN